MSQPGTRTVWDVKGGIKRDPYYGDYRPPETDWTVHGTFADNALAAQFAMLLLLDLGGRAKDGVQIVARIEQLSPEPVEAEAA